MRGHIFSELIDYLLRLYGKRLFALAEEPVSNPIVIGTEFYAPLSREDQAQFIVMILNLCLFIERRGNDLRNGAAAISREPGISAPDFAICERDREGRSSEQGLPVVQDLVSQFVPDLYVGCDTSVG